jgi:uncharacterized LabA/DUF88 family protein
MPERAILFVDGNNWYHGLKKAGVSSQGRLDFARVAEKVVGPRLWSGTRYYIGQVSQTGNTRLYADQRAFVARFLAQDKRHSVHYGRLEPRPVKSDAAAELLQYLGALTEKIDPTVFKDLVAIGNKHKVGSVMVEKAVDVMLAVDLVTLAEENAHDTAYVLSADGDYTHAVAVVRRKGKKVFALAASHGAQLAHAVNSFIHVKADWFDDCYRVPGSG